MEKRDFKIIKSNKATKIGEKQNSDELKPIQVTPPNHLSVAAKTLYKNLYSEIQKAGYLKYIDQANLEMYCTTYDLYLECEDAIGEYGVWLEDEDGYPIKRAPQAIQLDSCIKNLKSLGFSLGLSFDSGLRQITIKEPPEKQNNSPLEEAGFGSEI